jgi:hypothetical protein
MRSGIQLNDKELRLGRTWTDLPGQIRGGVCVPSSLGLNLLHVDLRSPRQCCSYSHECVFFNALQRLYMLHATEENDQGSAYL